MKYRTLPHGGEQIGIIGMGSSVVGEQTEKDIIETVCCAVEHGVNYFDLAAGHASCFPAYGKALSGCREKVYLQVHFGANYTTGEYGWTTDLDEIKRSIDWQLKNLKTDYIDFGFIHCLDEMTDVEEYEKSGALQYVLDMKAQGVVRHIGLSSHNPATVHHILDRKLIDMLMFSINPMYDYGQGDYAFGSDGERQLLYRRCAKEGVGISVMKPYNAGQLLDEKQSPFKKALTTAQCIQYALDKPGVLTVLPGAGNVEQLKQNLSYLEASEEDCDYSMIASLTPEESKGRCVYCNHCAPCPEGLNVGLINKYYDLVLAGDPLAGEHYRTLAKTAEDCVGCGHCSGRCPFHVDQEARMREIREYFK